ncbi:hypothetical protein [Shimia sp. SDUM112013]|uniref:hypothetical protein n=1 Tax=Shimia sp. SDUM112013 TaxID=3136160 RepID=UPI0032EBD16C
MIRTLTLAAACAIVPALALAGGANTKTGIGEKNGPECAPGFYYDERDKMCIAANWL